MCFSNLRLRRALNSILPFDCITYRLANITSANGLSDCNNSISDCVATLKVLYLNLHSVPKQSILYESSGLTGCSPTKIANIVMGVLLYLRIRRRKYSNIRWGNVAVGNASASTWNNR